MTATSTSVEREFEAVLPQGSVRAATIADAVCGMQPRAVLEPSTEQELAAALRVANDAGLAIVPRGGGTKLSWGNAPHRTDVILSTARLNKIIEHVWADLTVSVQAGCTVQFLQAALAQHGQRLAIDTLWPEQATIGGILSTNDSGALRLRFGSLRDLIIGVTIALPDGTLASSGGKVVKNVAGYDLPKLVTGAFGTLGVITRAVFRLHPLPHNSKTLSIAVADLAKVQQLLSAVQDSHLAHTSLQVRAASDATPVVDILFEGTEAGIAAQTERFFELVALSGIAAQANEKEMTPSAWNSSQEQWDSCESAAIGKITVLPARIAETIERLQPLQLAWRLALQAIGVGSLRLDGSPDRLHASLKKLRSHLESSGGSLAIRHRPMTLSPLDAWGPAGDALPLMRALKSQFDSKNTLNPGRFVGGI